MGATPQILLPPQNIVGFKRMVEELVKVRVMVWVSDMAGKPARLLQRI